ncbi:MAG: OmpA family protein [Myxococcota bacterium]
MASGLSLAASGCALSSQYREAIEQRQELVDRDEAQSARIGRLESDSVSIQSELADAYELVEDLRVENGELSDQVADLEQQESLLSEGLREQNAQMVRFQSDLERANQEVSQLTETYGELMSELESEVSAGRIQIDQLREGVRVAVSDEVLFDSGSARIDRQGEEVVRKISGQLASMDHRVEVQGHTDNLAISGNLAAAYPSNWELAAARAAAVVRLMEEEGVASDRLTLTSFASNRPISENDSAEGRAMNRRIEIRLRPQGRATVSGDDLPVQSSPTGP